MSNGEVISGVLPKEAREKDGVSSREKEGSKSFACTTCPTLP